MSVSRPLVWLDAVGDHAATPLPEPTHGHWQLPSSHCTFSPSIHADDEFSTSSHQEARRDSHVQASSSSSSSAPAASTAPPPGAPKEGPLALYYHARQEGTYRPDARQEALISQLQVGAGLTDVILCLHARSLATAPGPACLALLPGQQHSAMVGQ